MMPLLQLLELHLELRQTPTPQRLEQLQKFLGIYCRFSDSSLS